MPARIALVHDDRAFTGAAARALAESGFDVRVFPDPLIALDALGGAERMELVITRADFPAGRSNGAALALMVRQQRPEVKILFVCRPSFRKHVEDLGEVLATPVTVLKVVEVAARLLQAAGTHSPNR